MLQKVSAMAKTVMKIARMSELSTEIQTNNQEIERTKGALRSDQESKSGRLRSL